MINISSHLRLGLPRFLSIAYVLPKDQSKSKAFARLGTWLSSYGEELLESRPTPKLEDHPLPAVSDCLFNIFAVTVHIGGPSSIHNLRTRHFKMAGTHLSRFEGPRVSISRSSSLEMKALRPGEWSGRVHQRPGVTYLKT